ncbi:Peptidase S8, subtilisin-related like protein [Aduncisulcus paluster]|uniref:Peptidase S8, subtilisin-related like protein n=1 Tax=Aduncisulcus paluster TaxID=2918883 RepID=A0ABQ5JXM5_9EUKA|nr:Peptidase S8, subtilisin-related like protein [Aduncisulcus paluster]
MFSDPLYSKQWHLHPSSSYTEGHATTYTNIAWEESGGFGDGIVIAVVDDGLHTTHPDISPNYIASLSKNYVTGSDDPTPDGSSTHGTSCAGLVAASSDNGTCGVGVAPNARLAGRKCITSAATVGGIANALQDTCVDVDIFTNSWGSSTCGSYSCPIQYTFSTWALAVAYCKNNGRKGKGSLYVFASGNERKVGGDSNLYSSLFPYAPHIAAVSVQGIVAPYSNPGAAVFTSSPSNGYSESGKVVALTTSSSKSSCTSSFGGTSGATPIVAGSLALLLEQNPLLDYREALYVLQSSCTVIDPYFSGSDAPSISTSYLNGTTNQGYFWRLRPNGSYHNRNYGFGMIHTPSLTRLGPLVVHGRIPALDAHTDVYTDDPNIEHASLSTDFDLGDGITWDLGNGSLAIPFKLLVTGTADDNVRFIAEYMRFSANISNASRGVENLLISVIIPSSLSATDSNPILGDMMFPVGRKDSNTKISSDSYSLSASLYGTPLKLYSSTTSDTDSNNSNNNNNNNNTTNDDDEEIFYVSFSSPLLSSSDTSLSFTLSSISLSVYGYVQYGAFTTPFNKQFQMVSSSSTDSTDSTDDMLISYSLNPDIAYNIYLLPPHVPHIVDMYTVNDIVGGVLRIADDVTGDGEIDLAAMVDDTDFLSNFDISDCSNLATPQATHLCENMISEHTWRTIAIPVEVDEGIEVTVADSHVIVSSAFTMNFGNLPVLFGTDGQETPGPDDPVDPVDPVVPSNKLSGGVIAGIILASVSFIGILVFMIICCCKAPSKGLNNDGVSRGDLDLGVQTYDHNYTMFSSGFMRMDAQLPDLV